MEAIYMFLSLTRFLALLRSELSYSGRCRRDDRLTQLHALCLVHTTAPSQPKLPTREPTLLRVLLFLRLLLLLFVLVLRSKLPFVLQ